ncbi:hypothetical protein BIZ89_gp027 [Bacillus phage Kida]|uniref:hypothetical protein n=1 Tax=Bacillus phage Kida TaxID=1873998 RepID=UPI0008111C36|nr:hypothetical protein BIZ89_gp027 [Bacillus phage Kida]ANU80046.1 hypothetical protein KIDA_27 [Bacillus phage Kida]QDH50011.1 hypothetical protein ALPS_24 [Bacillus phage ALPS]
MFKLKKKIRFSCMFNDYADNQDDYLTVTETGNGFEFKIEDKRNKVNTVVKLPLLTGMEVGVALHAALVGTEEKRFGNHNNNCLWVRDTKVRSKPAISILLADDNNSESICLTTADTNKLYDFIKEAYNNGMA